MLLPVAAQSADYQLGTMDKLRIRVVEWRTAEGAVRDWSSISGDYTVGPSGNISLPFIGEMPASGKTTTDISTAIGEELQQKFGLLDKPDASVELAEFRPVFLSGDVETPGQYPFAPNLTVLKALSLAGGLHRADSGQRIERDFINARGNYDVLVSQRNGLIARRARLISEAEDKDIEFPKELQDSADGKKLITDETNFKLARAKKLRDQLQSNEDLRNLLQSEIASLEKKIVTQNRQMELYRKELDSIGNLADRGLVVNSRVLSLEQSVSDLQGKVLDMETASLRAKQDISKATQDAADLQSDRDTEIAQDRQSTEADIEGLSLKIGMYKDLIAEALSHDPGAARSSSASEAPPVSYSIVRENDGKASEIPVDENTPVQPGDVIKVGILPIPAN
ncbi:MULTISPECIES: polysaccharide biosynthesis/export family protein [unclassified Mesorhizobium]|uniref:polysaccharide biosynthesis/export family protein n=1 Tax=unclassified Mesorhizobium TaxID=325217 RepID=UPI003015615A